MNPNTSYQPSSPPVVPSDPFKYNSFYIPYKNESVRQVNLAPTTYHEPHRFSTIQSVELQVTEILNRQSVGQRCLELTNLIKDCFNMNSAKNISTQFKPIVENIFGLSSSQLDVLSTSFSTSQAKNMPSSSDWMLKNISRSKNPVEYEAVITFLHPDGILFSLIKTLMMETATKFEFPFSYFPPSMRVMIENGLAPAIFSNKIASINYMSASHLVFNPFEFYIFNFIFYIINNQSSSAESSNTSVDLSDIAYFELLQIYLNHFAPTEVFPRASQNLMKSQTTTNQTSLWQSLSSTTSSLLNMATNSNLNNPSGEQLNSITAKTLPSLFKASLLQLRTPFSKPGSAPSTHQALLYSSQGDNLGSLEWRCNTFILMAELWLGNTQSSCRVPPIISLIDQNEDYSLTTVHPFNANPDQMRSIRILVKHLHQFSNSLSYIHIDHHSNQRLGEIKQAVWTSKYPLQRKLYSYLRMSFTRWPMDSSFRLPLETWLSYIQPWRYANTNSSDNMISTCDIEDNDNLFKNAPPSSNIDQVWKNFISDNLLYYTVIFGQILQRLLQLDLASSRNALMLSRVLKVYSQPGFMNLLRDAEETVCRINIEQKMSSLSPKQSGGSILTSSYDSNLPSRGKLFNSTNKNSGRSQMNSVGFKTRFSPFKHHLMECETDPEFSYTSLFSPQMKQQVARLLLEAYRARQTIKEFVQSVDAPSSQLDKGWIQSFVAFLTSNDTNFESMDEREMYNDRLKADGYLSFATSKLSAIFEIDPLTEEQITASHSSFSRLDDAITPISILKHRSKNKFSTPKPDVDTMDSVGDFGSPKLTPLGRFQIMNKLAKSDNFCEGNPDLQPVRSFEISFVVTLAIFISNWINDHYRDTIARAYSSDGISGWITRSVLSPPVSYIEIHKKQDSIAPQRVVKNLPARINLRFLAHKYVLISLVFVWLSLYLFIM